MEKLRKYSTYEKSTVNTVINKLLLQAAELDIVTTKSNLIPTESELIRSIPDKLCNGDIVGVAKTLRKNHSSRPTLSMRGNYDIKDWIDIIKTRSAEAGF